MPHKIKITMKVVYNQTLYCRSYDTDNSKRGKQEIIL